MCRELVAELKERYPHLHRIYIRAEYQYISDDYEKHLFQTCDETYYSERAVLVAVRLFMSKEIKN